MKKLSRHILALFGLLVFSHTPAFAERTPEEFKAAIETASPDARNVLIDKILAFESVAHTPGLRLGGYPEESRRYEYLTLLFSESILSDPQSAARVGNGILEQIRKDSKWANVIAKEFKNAKGTKNLAALKALIPLLSFTEMRHSGQLNEWAINLKNDFRKSGMDAKDWPNLMAAGLIVRLSITYGNWIHDYRTVVQDMLPYKLDTKLEANLKKQVGLNNPVPAPKVEAKPAPTQPITTPKPPVGGIAATKPVPVPPPTTNDGKPNTATLPPPLTHSNSPSNSNSNPNPTPTPPPINTNPTPPPTPATVPFADRTQTVQEWVELMTKLQTIEKQIGRSSDAGKRADLQKEADELFDRGMKMGRAVLAKIDKENISLVDLKAYAAERNLFFDMALENLRKQSFLPLLYGYRIGEALKKGERPYGNPRTSALASIALAYAGPRHASPVNAPKYAEAIKATREHYDTNAEEQEQWHPKNPKAKETSLKALTDTEKLYRDGAEKGIIAQLRGGHNGRFEPSPSDQVHLQKLGIPTSGEFTLDEKKLTEFRAALKELSTGQKAYSAEAYYEMLVRLDAIEAQIKKIGAGDAEQLKHLNTAADELFTAMKKMSAKGLDINGVRSNHSHSGTARENFRAGEIRIFLSNTSSPRVLAATLHGFSGTALRKGNSSKDVLDAEKKAVTDELVKLDPNLLKDPVVNLANQAFDKSHSWTPKEKPIPSGPIPLKDPKAQAEPSNAGMADRARQEGGAPRPFLDVEWWKPKFISQVTDRDTQAILKNLAVLLDPKTNVKDKVAAVQALKTADPKDFGLLLAATDVLRESRDASYKRNSNSAQTGQAPPKTYLQRSLVDLLDKWRQSYTKVRTSGTPSFDLARQLLGEEGRDRNHEQILTIAGDRLLRLQRSGDPILIGGAARIAHAAHNYQFANSTEREEAASFFRSLFNNEDSELAEHFKKSPKILEFLRRIHTRLNPPDLTAQPPTQPTPPPVVTEEDVSDKPVPPPTTGEKPLEKPAEEKRKVEIKETSPTDPEIILNNLELLAGKKKLSTAVRNSIWEELLIESLDHGMTDEKVVEALLKWAQDTTQTDAERAKALRLLLHSWNRLPDIFKAKQALAEQMDDAISDIRREIRKRGTTVDPLLADTFDILNKVKLGGMGYEAGVRGLAEKLNCTVVLDRMPK